MYKITIYNINADHAGSRLQNSSPPVTGDVHQSVAFDQFSFSGLVSFRKNIHFLDKLLKKESSGRHTRDFSPFSVSWVTAVNWLVHMPSGQLRATPNLCKPLAIFIRGQHMNWQQI